MQGVCPKPIYRAIMCFKNLSRFFKLDLMVLEFFYFFKVRCYKNYAQVCVCNAKLFGNLSQGDHVWHVDVLEVSGRWEGEVKEGPFVPFTYYDGRSYLIDLLQLCLNFFDV